MLGDDEDYFGKENKVWAEFVNQAKTSLKLNENTILDATHISVASRNKIHQALINDLFGVEINIIYLHGNLETALNQNQNRTGRAFVPKSVVRRMYYSADKPTLEEWYINKIYDINVDKDTMIIKTRG